MKSIQKELIIGPSTGWLYENKIYPPAHQEIILKQARANGLEVCLVDWSRDDKRIRSLREKDIFDEKYFSYRSLHLPDHNEGGQRYEIAMTENIMSYYKADTAVIHPLKINGQYPEKYYKKMISRRIPLAIENMDAGKKDGSDLDELKKIVNNTRCRFVLDVQHAYEHDPKMDYADDLLKELKTRLAHLHVSGEIRGNNHSPLYRATNAEQIMNFIRQVISIKAVPLIIEGEYSNSYDLQKEMRFIKNRLDPDQSLIK